MSDLETQRYFNTLERELGSLMSSVKNLTAQSEHIPELYLETGQIKASITALQKELNNFHTEFKESKDQVTTIFNKINKTDKRLDNLNFRVMIIAMLTTGVVNAPDWVIKFLTSGKAQSAIHSTIYALVDQLRVFWG